MLKVKRVCFCKPFSFQQLRCIRQIRWEYRLFTVRQLLNICVNAISSWLRPVFVSLLYCESILQICVSTFRVYAIKFWATLNIENRKPHLTEFPQKLQTGNEYDLYTQRVNIDVTIGSIHNIQKWFIYL